MGPTDTASATAVSAMVATGRGLLMPSLRLSPRLRPMPLFCTEATATATPLPLPTGATPAPTPPTPTAPTPTPTPTASATSVSATATAGNSPHPYVHRGHHLRACCLGVGGWSGIQQEDPEWLVNATESVCPQFPWEFDLEAFSFQLF